MADSISHTNFNGPNASPSSHVQDALQLIFLDGGVEVLLVGGEHQHVMDKVESILLGLDYTVRG